jgi:N-acetyl-gamma-glutamyl-phosphate reductase
MKKVKVGLLGAGGYTGGELIRLLVNHPEVDLVFAHSQSQAGKKVYSTHSDLLGETELEFSSTLDLSIQVLFLCMGHGESRAYLEKDALPSSISIIDLSQDFRIISHFEDREFIYGLPEINREKIRHAHNIANPGCFATTIQLALLPLVSQANPNNQDWTLFGTTGSTGAGRGQSSTSHFSWRNQNLSVYKAFTHQHLEEIKKTFHEVHPGVNYSLHFIPQRGNFSRGIMVSVVLKTDLSLNSVKTLYQDFYQKEPFVFVSENPVDLKSVVNTNKVFISFEKHEDHLLINACLDNLIKGASGQALQNMNIMLGLEETLGLKLKSIAY